MQSLEEIVYPGFFLPATGGRRKIRHERVRSLPLDIASGRTAKFDENLAGFAGYPKFCLR